MVLSVGSCLLGERSEGHVPCAGVSSSPSTAEYETTIVMEMMFMMATRRYISTKFMIAQSVESTTDRPTDLRPPRLPHFEILSPPRHPGYEEARCSSSEIARPPPTSGTLSSSFCSAIILFSLSSSTANPPLDGDLLPCS